MKLVRLGSDGSKVLETQTGSIFKRGVVVAEIDHLVYLGLLVVIAEFDRAARRCYGVRGSIRNHAVVTTQSRLADPDDTIVALSSVPGPALRAIVRLSGRQALPIAASVCPSSIHARCRRANSSRAA